MANYNSDKLEASGTLTGTSDITYNIEIVTDSGTNKFKWRKKVGNSAYDSFSSNTTITLNTDISLSNGISIKFTQSSISNYNNNDKWTFTAYTDLDFTTDNINRMSIIEKDGISDLILFSDTGDVSKINDFENNPELESSLGNIGQFDKFDIEKKNKELYIALGQNANPKWAGYLKNSGLDNTPDERFVVENTLDRIDSTHDPSNEVFSKFVVLRNDEADTKDCKGLVGIKPDSTKLHIYNITTGSQKVFKYEIGGIPQAIRPWYGKNSGSGNYYCRGVIVLLNREISNEIAELQFWAIGQEGTDANIGTDVNREKTINLRRPSSDSGHQINDYHDFLVIPTSADLSSAEYTLILVAGRKDREINKANVNWLFKVAHADFYTKSNDDDVSSSNFINITPEVDFSANNDNGNSTGTDGAWHWGFQSPIGAYTGDSNYSGNEDLKFYLPINQNLKQCIVNFTDTCLHFAGFDANGNNPSILFTCKFRNIRTVEVNNNDIPLEIFTSDETTDWTNYTSGSDSSFNKIKITGPLISDDADDKNKQRFYPVVWGTYAIYPNSVGGTHQAKLFAHASESNDYGNFENVLEGRLNLASEINTLRNGSGAKLAKVLPSMTPVMGQRGTMYIYGNRAVNASRSGLIYWSPINKNFVHYRFSVEASAGVSFNTPSIVDIFPSQIPENYTNWVLNNDSTATDINAKTLNTHFFKYALPSSYDTTASLPWWSIGEGDYSISLHSSNWYAEANESFFGMNVPSENDTIKKAFRFNLGLSNDSAFTDLIPTDASLIEIVKNSTQPSSTPWQGDSTTQKVFYKISLVYDGYQETEMLSSQLVVDNHGGVETSAIAVDIKIKVDSIINSRITGVVLYRGETSNASSVEPEQLYRMVDEIKLKDFNLPSGSSYYVAEIIDTGKGGATYESINGVSELSYGFNFNYTLNAQQNGYMFVGNCEHSQFEDASNYILRSQPGKYSIFDWTRDFVALPFTPVALQGFMGKIYAFSHTQLAIINAESLFIEDVIDGVGCIGPDALKVTDAGLFFCDYKNIYLSSPKILAIGELIKEVETLGWNKLSNTAKETARIGFDGVRNTFMLFFTSGSTYRCWAYSVSTSRWDLWETSQQVLSTVESKDGHCILLQKDGKIIKYLGNPTNKRNWEWESKKLTFGYDMQEKRIRNIKIAGNDRTNTNISYKVDGYDNSWNTGTDISSKFTGNSNSAIKLNSAHGTKQNWIKYKVTGTNDTSGSDRKVSSISTIYKAKRFK